MVRRPPGSTLFPYPTLFRSTRLNLDLTRTARSGNRTGTLLHVLDKTRTPMGGRLLRRWLGTPLLDPAALTHRQDVVETLVQRPALRGQVQDLLDAVGDLERTAARTRQGSATARDLLALATGLRSAAGVKTALTPGPSPAPAGAGSPGPPGKPALGSAPVRA